jgi:hypothetical protein
MIYCLCLYRGGERKANAMADLPQRTLCLCVKLSSLSVPNSRASNVANELVFPLGPLFAILTSPFKPKSFVCNTYKKHGGGRGYVPPFVNRSPNAPCGTHSKAGKSNPLIRLLHNSRTPGGWGSALRHRPADSAFSLQPLTFNFRLSPPVCNHDSPVTKRGPRNTGHGSRLHEPANL